MFLFADTTSLVCVCVRVCGRQWYPHEAFSGTWYRTPKPAKYQQNKTLTQLKASFRRV